jgi:hypothetical protein
MQDHIAHHFRERNQRKQTGQPARRTAAARRDWVQTQPCQLPLFELPAHYLIWKLLFGLSIMTIPPAQMMVFYTESIVRKREMSKCQKGLTGEAFRGNACTKRLVQTLLACFAPFEKFSK